MKRRRTEEQEEEEEREESEDRSTSSNGAASSSPPAVNTTRQARFHRLVYEKVREVKKGEIATYGRIAKAIGLDNYSRHVGFALAALPGSNSSTDVPWWRVINGQGQISFRPGDRIGEGTRKRPFTSRQRVKLEKEGHSFSHAGTLIGFREKLHVFN